MIAGLEINDVPSLIYTIVYILVSSALTKFCGIPSVAKLNACTAELNGEIEVSTPRSTGLFAFRSGRL